MYLYLLNEENYIVGQRIGSDNTEGCYVSETDLNPYMLPTGQPRYQIVDGKHIETPFDWDSYNLEQLAKQRDIKIVSAIREIYSIDDEYKLINLGIANSQDPEYLEYRQTVEKIKQEVTMQ